MGSSPRNRNRNFYSHQRILGAMSEPHVLLSLPTLVLDEIMKNLSPLDYLNLARVDKHLYKFIFNYPKKYRELECSKIYDWNNDPTQPSYQREYYEFADTKTKAEALDRMIIMKDYNQIEEPIFVDLTWEQINKLRDDDDRLLYNNATVEKLQSTSKLLDLNIKTTFIRPEDDEDKDDDNLDLILEQIARFGATDLQYTKNRHPSQSFEVWRKFLSHEIVCNLQYIQLKLPEEFLPLLLKYSAPRMDIFNEDLENINVLIDTLAEMIREWMEERRQINIFKFHFSFEDGAKILEEFRRVSSRLAQNHPGGFIEDWRIDEGCKLIKRKDGRALFLRRTYNMLTVIECDYKLRRENIMGEEIEVDGEIVKPGDVDAQLLEREQNINQHYNRRSFLRNLMLDQNRSWPDKRYYRPRDYESFDSPRDDFEMGEEIVGEPDREMFT